MATLAVEEIAVVALSLRSLLLVPADREEEVAAANDSGADALVLDLQGAVAKGRARRAVFAFLNNHAGGGGPPIFVRVNPGSSGLSRGDLDAVLPGAPAGIVLAGCSEHDEITLLSARIAVCEALHGLRDGATRIVPAPAAPGAFAPAGTARPDPRLAAIAWDSTATAAMLGARSGPSNEDYTGPLGLVRSLCVFAASAAKVPAIDGPAREDCDPNELRLEAERAARDGFAGKFARHPDQVAAINEAFSRPSTMS